MNRFLAVLVVFATAVVAGCASHPAPELRGYTAEETRELAMESLGRRGLSFEEYHQKKTELLGSQTKTIGFDEQGEISADSGGYTGGHRI